MSNNTRQAQDSMESSPAHRQQYEAPSLKVFGPVGALTQSGTVGTGENPGSMMDLMA